MTSIHRSAARVIWNVPGVAGAARVKRPAKDCGDFGARSGARGRPASASGASPEIHRDAVIQSAAVGDRRLARRRERR